MERIPSLFSLGVGEWNVLKKEGKEGVLQCEYLGQPFWGRQLLFFRPILTALITEKLGMYWGGGLAVDLHLGPYICFMPSFATGFYRPGRSKNLGYPLENRSAGTLSLVLTNGARISAEFYHLSNGSLASKNPGVEVLVLQYSIPLY